VETRPHLEVLPQPAHDLLDRRPDRLGVAADFLVQRDLAAPERSGRIKVDLPVAELAQREDQRVVDGHSSVPVEDQRHELAM